MKIIDAKDLIVGRFATRVAKLALNGDEVAVVNCDKAIMTGSKADVVAKFKRKQEMGVPKKGPFLHRSPDKLVRRVIRGMLPYKQSRGSEAYSRVKCYTGIPDALTGKELETFENANISKVPSLKYVNMLTISKILGAKQ